MTDVSLDIISGFVAAGTLALAAASFGNISEIRRTAIDASSPRIVVSHFSVDEQPMRRGAMPDPWPRLMPYESWDLERDGDEMLALTAEARVRNEGTTSAFVRIDAPGLEVLGPTLHTEGVSHGKASGRANGSYALPPGQVLAFQVWWWRTAAEWAATTAMPTIEFRVRSQGALEHGVRDSCALRFGAYVLVEHDGWKIADHSSENSADVLSQRAATIGALKRTYPVIRWWPWKQSV